MIVLREVADQPVKPTLPYSILSNCWAYVKHIYPNTPSAKSILSNLGDEGEIGVLYYPKSGLYHYVVVESRSGEIVTFSETNYQGDTKSTRTLDSSAFVGFYDVK